MGGVNLQICFGTEEGALNEKSRGLNSRKTIFIAFTINHSSLADYFIGLSSQLSTDYNVVVFSSKLPKENSGLSKSVEVLKWPSPRPTTLKDAWFLLKNIRKHKPVMCISLFGSVNLMVLISWLCRVPSRIAWIRTLSTQYDNHPILIRRKKKVYRLATTIFANSKATKNDAQQVYNISSEKIFVLPNSIREYPDPILKEETQVRKITFAGRLHSSKGIDTLLKAFDKCLNFHQDIELNIIGDGEERKKLFSLVENYGIGNRVNFFGQLPKSEVVEHFKNAYMVVVPSITEAFGFVCIEAMSVTTPVIGSDTTGISEIIRNQEDGLLFQPKNHEELFDKMMLLLDDKSFAQNLGRKGYHRFMENYEHEQSIQRDTEILTKLLPH